MNLPAKDFAFLIPTPYLSTYIFNLTTPSPDSPLLIWDEDVARKPPVYVTFFIMIGTPMDTLESMRLFVRVVEAGSFTKAAALASVKLTRVSRAISDLELRLHIRLLNRTTRHMSLTEAGRHYLQHCEQILTQVEIAEAQATGAGAQPSGKLRIHANTSFGQHYLAPLIARYNQRFPEVQIELVLAQRAPEIVEEGFDVSVVAARKLEDSVFVSQRIGSMYTILCASPRYLSRQGTPATLADLARHTCLQLVFPNAAAGDWHFEGAEEAPFRHPRPTPFTVNVAEAMAETIREGMGIGPLPISVALPGLRDGTLIRVLPAFRLQTTDIYALYASRRYLDAKIRTFVEFLREQVPLTLAEQNQEIVRLQDGRVNIS